MKPFLRQIAEAYVSNRCDELIDTCFVFPNKRCAAFFSDYLSELLPHAMFMPAMTSIDDLVCDLTELVIAPRLELLFDLYECYRKIISRRKSAVTDDSFDTFLPWGEMVLRDFDDIDRYCVHAPDLLKNISNFKEISSNYLTEEQIDIINRYWNDPISYADQVHLWRHLNPDDTAAAGVKNFFNLWVILDELYNTFRKKLKDKGVAYSGMAYRKAADMVSELPASRARYSRYVFVGFNALSESEETILKWFRNNGLGDFYWDWDLYTPPELAGINPAGNFVEKYRTMFPSDPDIDYDFEEWKPKSLPEITVIGVPSKIGQVKETARILTGMVSESPDHFKGVNAKETAVVLPEENLCLPLISSFAEGICKFNVTMGYPMRYTPVSTLIRNVERMVSNSKILRGEPAYYYQDLITVMSHPLVHNSFPLQADQIISEINMNHIFNYRRNILLEKFPDLSPLFPLKTESDTEALEGILSLLNMLKSITDKQTLDHTFVLEYIKALETIRMACEGRDIGLSRSTIIHLLSQLTDGETVNFEGNPLDGVQMMGVLETRALDFDNLFILSMNDGIFPRNTRQNSFIPNDMRGAYGMSTTERHEAVYAYYFYRLISRAGRVWLIYDSRSANGGGEVSHYINQLKYLLTPPDMKFISKTYQIKPVEPRTIEIPKVSDKTGIMKDNDIMEKINRFRDPDNPRYLSPTSISRFLECPLGFFLEYIADYREPDEIKDFIDASKWGTIVHLAMENLYTIMSRKTQQITPVILRQLLHSQRSLIEREVVRAYMKEFLKQELAEGAAPRLSSLTGANALLAEMIMMMVCKIIEREAESEFFGNFEFIKGEMKFEERIKLSDDLSVNVKGSIDRVDRTFTPDGQEVIKLIDYKTGSAVNEIDSVEEIFEKHDNKAVIQLLLYCNGYAVKNKFSGIIKPVVYKIKTLPTEPLVHIVSNEDGQIDDYRKVNATFLEAFRKAISPLFDPNVPFTQATDDDACRYCKFTGICDRNPQKF
ncbi:MAG: PD-(D/E)XK nuclease family protein [Muribaculaceae bacterium]|nr:PD-(D/E)XK nuclease family protein [Muribaculaceae bacterium]